MPVLYPSTLKAQWGRTLLLVLFALAYASISFVNHYNFRTATLDLGLIAQAVGEVAQLRWPQTTLLLDSPPTPFLGQHFSLTPLLAVPLYYVVGGAWALLLVQTGALLLGALGVWRYAQAQGASPGVCNWALAFFASQWGIYSALSFDYHDNVVGAMALPWLALWVGQRRVGPAVAAALVVLLSKENMALWLAFVLLGLAWQQWRQRAVAAWLAAGALAALGYFVVITQVVMPALDVNHRAFTQVVRYAHLGPTLPAAVANVLLHPRLLWDVVLHNTLPDPLYDHIKRELWVAILLSGGWALVWRPWYALMLLPILGQKLLSNDFVLWGINGHYSIELAPVLALAATDALCSWRWGRVRHLAWAGALAGVLLFTFDTFSTRFSRWYTPVTNNPLLPEHYTSAVPDRNGLYAALAQVPADVPLSASSSLVPHLLNRQAVYLFPVLRNARLVALLREPGEAAAWPLSPEVARQALAQFQADANYRTMYEDAQLVVLARRFAPTDSAITWKAQP